MFDVYSKARRVESGEVGLRVTDHGPETGAPVLLIHGFPDSARLWRHQIPVLSQSGFRTLAPDLRGFGGSDKPSAVSDYALDKVAGDMITILDDAGVHQAHVVGHDWGAGLAWFLAIAMPDRVRSLVTLSVGHPTAFREAGLRQIEKTWYMLLFQFPDVAEQWLSENDWQNMRIWTGDEPELENWIEDLSRPGALTASLGLYRANMGPERLVGPQTRLPPARVPVMGVWSSGDRALVEEQMQNSANHVAGEFRYERMDGVSHWIPLGAPEELNRLLLDWLPNH